MNKLVTLALALLCTACTHNTIIIETQSQKRYAVDSWFHNNGQPAEIITLEKWKKGWKPKVK